MEYEYILILNSEETKIEKWAKTLVGFSNSIGGYIIIGVNDDGEIIGFTAKELDATKNLVLITINRHIFPHIKVVFDTILVDARYILIIKVSYSNQIVVYKSGDYNEKVYIRENGATVVASVNQILTLGKRKFGVDNQILDKTFSKNNFTKFYSLAVKYRKDEKKLDESILISKELICEDGRITSGLNMFSDDYSDDDTLIVCLLWNGFTKGVDETLDVKEYKGSISKIFEECINFIKRNTRSGFIKMRDGSRLDTESYPELAIREAVVNAIAHRDYSISGTQIDVDIYKNRIEIMSPGAWLLQKSPSMYSLDKIPSIRRNKVICDCFLVAGLMEKSGSGFKKISNLYQELPIKQPVLESTLDIFKITLYDTLFDEDISEEINSFVSKYDQLILDYCYDVARTRDEIQNYLGYASRSNFTTKILNPLLKRNYLIKTAPNKSKYQKYITNKLKYKK